MGVGVVMKTAARRFTRMNYEAEREIRIDGYSVLFVYANEHSVQNTACIVCIRNAVAIRRLDFPAINISHCSLTYLLI